jgi:hypothetical protein
MNFKKLDAAHVDYIQAYLPTEIVIERKKFRWCLQIKLFSSTLTRTVDIVADYNSNTIPRLVLFRCIKDQAINRLPNSEQSFVAVLWVLVILDVAVGNAVIIYRGVCIAL